MAIFRNVAALNPFERRKQSTARYHMGSQQEQLGDIYTRDLDREPAPIASVAVGSAGMQRTAFWVQKMNAMGGLGRIQSLVVYDCNSTNIRQWTQAASASGIDKLSIVPEYLPLSEGFLRQPNFFMSHYGAIERDIERIVDDMERLANEAGVRPQIILEWIGFGGHARLSFLFHEHLADRFPGSKFLPIYCMPAERVLEQNIRDYRLWDEAENIVGPISSIITDNRASGSLQTLDERVALGLAAMEACYRFRPEVGTVAETVSMFNLNGSRWLSLEATDLPYRINQRQDRRRSNQVVSPERKMAHSAVVQSLKEAIWRIAAPGNDEHHTGYFVPPDHSAEQRIYCVLPFTPEILEEIKVDVEDQLHRETFSGPYAGTKVAFAPGNALWRSRDDFTYGHIFKIVGTPANPVPPSIERILREDGNFRTSRRRVLSRGEAMMLEMGLELSQKAPKQNVGLQSLQEKHSTGLLDHENGASTSDAEAEPDNRQEQSQPNFDQEDLGHGPAELIDPGEVSVSVAR